MNRRSVIAALAALPFLGANKAFADAVARFHLDCVVDEVKEIAGTLAEGCLIEADYQTGCILVAGPRRELGFAITSDTIRENRYPQQVKPCFLGLLRSERRMGGKP